MNLAYHGPMQRRAPVAIAQARNFRIIFANWHQRRRGASKTQESIERRDREVAALPASPPTPAPQTAAYEPKQQEKHDGPYEGVEDESNDAAAKMDAEPWQQPVAYKCADQADNQVSDQAETAALHDSAGEPSCDKPHDENDQKTLIG
jgi:hypothetical protein